MAKPNTPPKEPSIKVVESAVDYFAVESGNSAMMLEPLLVRAAGLGMRLQIVFPRPGTSSCCVIFERRRSGDMSYGQLKDALLGLD